MYGQVRELAEVRHVTRASDTDIRRAVWDAFMVGGMPYVIIGAAQYTPALEADIDMAHDDSGAPSIGDDASVDNDSGVDSGDQLQLDPAGDTTDALSDDACRNELEIPECVSVSALQVGWVPLAGRFVAPHDRTSCTHSQRTVSPSQARLQSFTHSCTYDRTYLTRSVPLPPQGAVVQVVGEAIQLHLRQAQGWVRQWVPSTGRLHIALAQHSRHDDAKQMRGHLDARAAHDAVAVRGAWQGEEHAWPHTRTREGHDRSGAHEAAVWPAEVQQTVDDMTAWHNMEHVHEHDHAQHHEVPQAHTACTRVPRASPSPTAASSRFSLFTAKFAPRIASLRKKLEITWERWGKPQGQNIKVAIQRMTAPLPAHTPRSPPPPPVGGGDGCVARPALPAHPPRSAPPPPVGGGDGCVARPALRPTPEPVGPSVRHTLVASQRGEINAGPVVIPMMAQPIDSAMASLPAVIPSSTSYRASPDAD